MIVHETPGHIDVRAFTTFGVNAKPNTKSPIGYFGTGLKYAIAVLVREGLRVTVWIGEEPHEFYCEPSNFRGKDFNLIRMRRQRGMTRKWMATDLPFTTELGKNWKLWMALRELHSNTLDENGRTFLFEDEPGIVSGLHLGRQDYTRIAVEGESYEQEYGSLSNIFLQGRGEPQNGVCIIDRTSKYGYYRGMRVYDLQRAALLTYSVETTLGLTEDRTLAASYMFDYYVRHAVMGLRDPQLIEKVLCAPDDTYESSITWQEDEYELCTPEFLQGVRRWGKKNTTVFITHERQKKVRQLSTWKRRLIDALELGDSGEIAKVAKENKDVLKAVLMTSYSKEEREADEKLAASAAVNTSEEVEAPAKAELYDEMPF